MESNNTEAVSYTLDEAVEIAELLAAKPKTARKKGWSLSTLQRLILLRLPAGASYTAGEVRKAIRADYSPEEARFIIGSAGSITELELDRSRESIKNALLDLVNRNFLARMDRVGAVTYSMSESLLFIQEATNATA